MSYSLDRKVFLEVPADLKKQKGWNLKAMPHRNEYMILISKAIIAILEVTFHIGYTPTI